MTDLSPKQRRFCEEYAIDLNATQAAVRAGYSGKTANPQGARLLANASIRTYIEELQAKKSAELDITAERVLKQLGLIAFGDCEPPKASDQVKALGYLMKYLGIEGPSKVELTGKDGGPLERTVLILPDNGRLTGGGE